MAVKYKKNAVDRGQYKRRKMLRTLVDRGLYVVENGVMFLTPKAHRILFG